VEHAARQEVAGAVAFAEASPWVVPTPSRRRPSPS
jgi:hypothetical protein